MRTFIGEEGTEQFTIETRVNGKSIRKQPIHDPFIHSTTVHNVSRWEHVLGIFRPRPIRVEVLVRGSEGAQRAIMTLDPIKLIRDTEEILESRQRSRSGQCLTDKCLADGRFYTTEA